MMLFFSDQGLHQQRLTKMNPWFGTRNASLVTTHLTTFLRNMSERAGIFPYYTNHSLRATTVTVLSSKNVETRKIKAVTGHRSNTSIQSYCERPTGSQFKQMSSTLSSFVDGKYNANGSTSSSMSSNAVVSHQTPENTAPAVTNKSLSLEKSDRISSQCL